MFVLNSFCYRGCLVVLGFVISLSHAAPTSADPGNVVATQKISDDRGGFDGDPDPGDWFGYSVAAMGDLNSDGRTAIAVGTPLEDDGNGDDFGAVWILFLSSDGKVTAEQKISVLKGDFEGGLDPGDEFGASVARIDDLDGNGVDDLAVGTPGDDNGDGLNSGAVWILFLAGDGTVIDEQKISDTEGGLEQNLEERDAFGIAVSSLGDFDGDGIADLLVGAALDDEGNGIDVGAFYILFLREDGTVRDEIKISETDGNFSGELHEGDWFGHGLAAIGDLDGDGVIDLAVGAPLDDDGSDKDSGAIWILFMTEEGTVRTQQKISDEDGGLIEFLNLSPGDLFGYDVAAPGDVNGDGIVDVLVGAPLDDDGGGEDVGAFWFLFLQTDGTVKGASKVSETVGGFDSELSEGDAFGASVAVIGDLNDDGFTDVVSGAPYDNDGGGVDSGAVWVLFLEGFNEACGDTNDDGTISVTDALVALNASVGLATCALCICDVDDSEAVTVTDALVLLNISVGLPLDRACPICLS
jgi:hypothetical protein